MLLGISPEHFASFSLIGLNVDFMRVKEAPPPTFFLRSKCLKLKSTAVSTFLGGFCMFLFRETKATTGVSFWWLDSGHFGGEHTHLLIESGGNQPRVNLFAPLVLKGTYR